MFFFVSCVTRPMLINTLFANIHVRPNHCTSANGNICDSPKNENRHISYDRRSGKTMSVVLLFRLEQRPFWSH